MPVDRADMIERQRLLYRIAVAYYEEKKTQEEIAAKRCASMVGSTERVLIEERNEKNGLLSGRTASSIIVEFPGEDEWIGEFKNVKVTEARNWILRGECVD